MDIFNSKVHRVQMELGGKLLTSLRIETQFFERLQRGGQSVGVDSVVSVKVQTDAKTGMAQGGTICRCR
jgi:hypothetical protein